MESAELQNLQLVPSFHDPDCTYDEALIGAVTSTFMVYNFSLDLKVARRRSSLSQSDCAQLLGTDHARISRLEAGTSMPNMVELSILCLIFDRPVGSVAQDVILSILADLEKRLSSMPGCPENWPDRDNRVRTLSSLAEKLRALGADSNE